MGDAVSDLWRDGRTTLAFWAPGAYTIVPGRHIGLDRAPTPAGEAWGVPSLVSGRVVLSIQTVALGRVVVVDTGRPTRRYISYCHGFYGDPLYLDDDAPRGGRVMRLALAGERPGSLWNGVHCHVVVHDNPYGAFQKGHNDTYYDPAVEIAAYVAGYPAGDGSTTFDPEEDDMYTDADRTRDEQTAATTAKNAADIAWLKDRIGGSAKSPDGSLSDGIRWLKARVGGSGSAPSLTDLFRQIRDRLK